MTFIKTLLCKYVCCIVLGILCFASAGGATYNRLYGIESLSSNLVSSICQDSQGYIWIATEYGLNRFDGVYFTQYYSGGVEGLAGNDISKLLADGDYIYIMMYYKLQIYSIKENRFYDIDVKDAKLPKFKEILRTPDGNVWLINSSFGVWQVDRNTLTATPVESVNKNFGMPSVGGAKIDSKGRLWINTSDGSLLMYDTDSKELHSYFDRKSPVRHVAGVMEDACGRIAVATGNDGIYLYDSETDTMEYLCETPQMTVVRTYDNGRGDMLFGTDRRGIWCVDIDRKSVYPAFPNIDEELMPKTIAWAFCEDKDGNAWIGFQRSGVMFVSQRQQPFNFVNLADVDGENGRNLTTMCFIANGNILLCQEGGGIAEVTQGGKLVHRWLPGIGISSVYPVGRDSVLIGTSYNRGAGILDMKSGNIAWLDGLTGRLGNPVKGVTRDKSGNIYIAEFGKGLYSLTPDCKKVRTLCGGRMKLHNRYFNLLTTDSRGIIWIGHYYGFDAYNPADDKVLQIKTDSLLRGAITYAIAEGSDGNMWFGTNRGLFLYEWSGKTWRHYSRADGLPNDVVCGIVDSRDGYLWISTLRGLCRLELKTSAMNNFYSGNGLQAFNYLRGAYGMSQYGTVYLGNERGFTYFAPSSVHAAGFHKGVTLTGVYFLGEKLLTADNEIRLDYPDNTFTLRFSTMDFREAENIYYEYRFQDEDEDVWHRTSAGVSEITLTHMQPGHQELFVRACDGGVRSEVKKIDIHIAPPWWLSWWALHMG